MKKSLLVVAATALAITSYGCGAGTDAVAPSAQIDSAPPSAPTGLVETVSPTSQHVVQWTANSESDLSGYQIYQYLPNPGSDNSYVLVATVSAPSTSWTVPNSDTPTTTWVRLRALDRSGNRSAQSAALQVQLMPAPVGDTGPIDDGPPVRH